MARLALALLRGAAPGPQSRDPAAERGPRRHVFEEAFTTVFDERTVADLSGDRRALSRRLPPWLALAIEVHRREAEFDAVVTWGERLSLALMGLQRVSGRRTPHVPMMYWFSKPNVRVPMRLFAPSAHSFITWSSVQRSWAVDHLDVPADRLALVKHPVDPVFWHPLPGPEDDLLCAVGSEMRDYPTLVEALRGTGIRCHIASEAVRINGWRGRRVARVADQAADRLPGLTVGRLDPLHLRALYARSRFVVVPILPSDTDNGVNVILEAMAMGKAVVCTRTEGQVDVLQDGVTGLFVRPSDPRALRAAILELWNDPARARAMGERGRRWVEAHHSIEKFTRDVREAIETSLRANPGPLGQERSDRPAAGPVSS